MDIRNWPLDRIMQLPDCCFGRRWQVNVCAQAMTVGGHWMISDAGFPESFVVWEVLVRYISLVPGQAGVFLKLGDQLPTAASQMRVLGDLLDNFGRAADGGHEVQIGNGNNVHLINLKVPVFSIGRRLVVQWDTVAEGFGVCEAFVVISAIPKEVPDWLFSARV